MKFSVFYTVRDLSQPTEKDVDMILRPCYMVIDRDGDFVDACNGKLHWSALDHVLSRVNRDFPENAPFRVIKWTGKEFVEITAVS